MAFWRFCCRGQSATNRNRSKWHKPKATPARKVEVDMAAKSRALEVQQKKELATREEKTVPARYFIPNTDIYETDDALAILMEMPGVDKNDITVKLESDVLRVEGHIDFSKYQEMEPVY